MSALKNQYLKDCSGKNCDTALNVYLYDATIPRDLHSGPGICGSTSQTLCGGSRPGCSLTDLTGRLALQQVIDEAYGQAKVLRRCVPNF